MLGEGKVMKREAAWRLPWRSAALSLAAVAMLSYLSAMAQPAMPAVIKVGVFLDTTGPTADVGVDYAKGVLDHVRYINDVERGIRGRVKVNLVWSDYGYRIPDALALYRKYRDVDRVIAMLGWGTGDTEALKDQINADQIPYISADYSAHLNNPAKTPYTFYPLASDADQLRAALRYMRDLASQEGIERPRIVFLYPDVPYGRSPIPGGKAYAQELGFEIGADQIVTLTAVEARSQIAAMQAFGAHFAWIGGTRTSASVIVRDARAAGLTARFFVNVWGFDESMITLIGKDAEGVFASTPHAYYGEPAAGMAKLFDVLRRFHNKDANFGWGTAETPFLASYVRGWLNVLLLKKGLEIAVDNWTTYARQEGLRGPSVRAALETLKEWDPEGLAPAITITKTDHRPSTTTRIVTIRKGRIVVVKQITIERRKDWLGH